MTVGQQVLQFFRTKVARTLMLLLSIFVAVGVGKSVFSITQKRGILQDRQILLEAEIARHEDLKQALEEATSGAFIERVAREKLGLVKEGEKVVIMDTSQATNLNDQSNEDVSPWKKWWQLFF